MGGGLLLDMGLILMKMNTPRKREIKAFSGPATIRIGDFGSFLMISPQFKGFNFDLLWSPVAARKTGGHDIVDVEPGQHLNMSYVLVDETATVRAMRAGTIGPKTTAFLARTQRDLMGRDVDAEQVRRDMERLFQMHPHGIPDRAFKARSKIGA